MRNETSADVWSEMGSRGTSGPPVVAVGPSMAPFAVEAVHRGGGQAVPVGTSAEALVWLSVTDIEGLRRVLGSNPQLRWVQLPFAGVEPFMEAGVVDAERAWTCAKGCYARPVAEHALALALAGLRLLHERVRASSWGEPAGTSLFGRKVVILGGGGIAEELLRLLGPFEVESTVVRARPQPMDRASAVVGTEQLDEVLGGSTVTFVALALTPGTRRIVDARRMALMGPDCWLVNVARGAHVDTTALVEALHTKALGGAALDVTDPEPLPDGHPLWSAPNCIITPHSADTPEMIRPLLAERITQNVARFAAGAPLVGLVDPRLGY